MKNLYATCFFLLGLFSLANAQSVCQIQPNPASGTGGVADTDVPVDAHITNTSNSIIHMKWERQVVSLTPSCETAVCDPNICWFRTVSSKTFNMDPGQTGDMLVHFYNNDTACSGIIHVKVTNLDNPDDVTTAVYYFNAATSTKELPLAQVKLYPNPVTEYFSLKNAENVASIRVLALDGREVQRYDANASNFYSLANQCAGTYVLSLEDKNGQMFQALEIIKR